MAERQCAGGKVRLASWTEKTKTWFWLEEPAKTLKVAVKRLELRDGRVEFAVAAQAAGHFKSWGRIPKLAAAEVAGSVDVAFEVEGSAAIGDGHLQDSKITAFAGKLHGLRFDDELARPMESLVEATLNDYAVDKNTKVREALEKAINRVRVK